MSEIKAIRLQRAEGAAWRKVGLSAWSAHGFRNLTMSGLRKLDSGLEVLKAVKDKDEAKALNNQTFSPLWMRYTERYRRIKLMPELTYIK